MKKGFRSGYVSLTGRPSVGKSTLLNAVLQQKISIVADRRQTTRTRILGIRTTEESQIIFVDTPGIHKPRHALGEMMVKVARDVLSEMDIVVFMTDPYGSYDDDRPVLDLLRGFRQPILFVLNKVDTITKARSERITRMYLDAFPFLKGMRLSAANGDGVDDFIRAVTKRLPEGPAYYDEETVTDQLERSVVSELIREKVILNTFEEVPHAVAVEIVRWAERADGIVEIGANLYVEREGQKGIIIGQKGGMLKTIGIQARAEIEALLGAQVFLELWVKVKKGWRNDPRILKELGYN